MLLFFDTETDGLVNPNQDHTHPSQPHLVQLGMVLCDESGAEWSTVELIVRPDGYVIPDGAARVHGITTAIARSAGVPLAIAVATFTNLRSIAAGIVAHNLPFDETVMKASIHRTGRTPSHPGPSNRQCTMTLASPVCAIPPTEKMKAAGFNKFKQPSLTEAHKHLFGEEFKGAHGALADARACCRVFFELKRRAEALEADKLRDDARRDYEAGVTQ